jgi:hypothetical protein
VWVEDQGKQWGLFIDDSWLSDENFLICDVCHLLWYKYPYRGHLFSFLVVLGFEFRALHLLSRHCIA